MQTIKTYFKGAPFYKAFVSHWPVELCKNRSRQLNHESLVDMLEPND
jgi:hypothetical protein